MPGFERHSAYGSDRIAFAPDALIMAGWTGRDRAAVDHHIAELAALGVPGPTRIPTFYRLDPALLAGPVPEIQVLGVQVDRRVERAQLAQHGARRRQTSACEPADPGERLEPPRRRSANDPPGPEPARQEGANPRPYADRRAACRWLARAVARTNGGPDDRAGPQRQLGEARQPAID